MSLIRSIQKAAANDNGVAAATQRVMDTNNNNDVFGTGLLPHIALDTRFVAISILYESIRYAVHHAMMTDFATIVRDTCSSSFQGHTHDGNGDSVDPSVVTSSSSLQGSQQKNETSSWLCSASQLRLYSTAVEQCLFVFFGDSVDLYQKKVTQLTYNLRANGTYLLQTYQPDQLVLLDDNLLAKGTIVEKKQMEYVNKVENCRKALNIEGFFKEFESNVAMATCPKCKNRDLTYAAVNTRSADEGQTVFFNCRNDKCKYKWSIRT